MGRKRRARKDLPQRMYFDHGAYYFVPRSGSKVNLGRELGPALVAYAKIVQPITKLVRISGVMDAYVREKLGSKKPRTVTDYLEALGRLRPVFGDMWPGDLEPKDVYAYLRNREAKVRGNREVAVLSNVMQQAIEMGLLNSNPCRQVRRNSESPRNRAVSESEARAFMHHCSSWMRAYVEVKMLTGLRQGDMLRLTKLSVRDDGLFVETGKRGKRLLFQWTPALTKAIDACKELRRRPSEPRFFPISASGFKSAWSRAMASYKTIEEKDQRFAENDLRAKVASEAVELGLDATSMLGHSSDAVTRRHYIRGTRKVQPLR